MVNWESKKWGDVLSVANGLVLVIFLNVLTAQYFFRLDLTEEKRFTIKAPTRELLKSLDDKVYVEVFLTGDLNAGFERFKKAIEETLQEFKIYSNNQLVYTFVDPQVAIDKKAQGEFMRELAKKGIKPTNVIEQKDGETITKLIYPGALISYGGFETGVMLLKGNRGESEINQSMEGIEYELASAIHKLTNTDRKRVGILSGHDELKGEDIASLTQAMLEQFNVSTVELRNTPLEKYDALIIPKPIHPFTELEKYKIDQFVMRGGKLVLFLDKLVVDMDSISIGHYLSLPMDVNLDDLLFKYGVRVNYDLVQDTQSGMYPVVVNEGTGRPEMKLISWPYFPLINHFSEHAVTRNLDAVVTRFASTIDTVKANGVRKMPLLLTSEFTKTSGAPVTISLQQVLRERSPDSFLGGTKVVGYLLEGTFTSLYKNRFLPEGVQSDIQRAQSKPTKVVVVADGDLVRNEVHPQTGQPQLLGFDPMSQHTFANQDFVMNLMAYLLDDAGLIMARNKTIKIRPLNREKIKEDRFQWQLINLGLPLIVVVLFGIVKTYWRKKKFANH